MAIDIVTNFIKTRKAFVAITGAQDNNNPETMSRVRAVPRTTYLQAFLAAGHFRKYAAPTMDQCVELVMKHRGVSKSQAFSICQFGDRKVNPREFKKTQGYLNALARFDMYTPGFLSVITKANQVYPLNVEFWVAAQDLAIERNAAGEVPYWGELAAESVKESFAELPSTVLAAGKTLADVIPDVGAGIVNFLTLLKWGVVAGVGVYAYQTLAKEKR